MDRRIIGSRWDRNNRNGMNTNFEYLFESRNRVESLVNLADEAIQQAESTNNMNENVQAQLDTLVVESGTSDAEVLQARTGADATTHATLKERLDATDDRLGDTAEVINVQHHGAVGDGETDDYVAIQGAISLAETVKKSVYIPGGEYYCSDTLRTEHKTTPLWSTGIHIFGDGKNTVLKGGGQAVVDYNNLETASTGAIFGVHGGNNTIENMTLSQGAVGVFTGQHPDAASSSHVSFTTVENIWMENVGTGVLMVHSSGNNYNRFKKIHILNCQIGVHLGKGIQIDQFNNNRNTFEDIRVSRSWIGYLVEQSDGCSFKNIYGEGMITDGTQFGPEPEQLPIELSGKPTAVVVLDGQLNYFDVVGVENCDWHLYSVGYRMSFDNMMVRDDRADRSLVMFPDPNRQPVKFIANTIINPFYTYQPDAGIHYDGSNGAAIKSRMFDMGYHWQTIPLDELSPQISSVTSGRSRIRRLGGMFTWFANFIFELDSSADGTSDIKIDLPFADEITLGSDFYGEPIAGGTFSFPVYASYNANFELVRGRFSDSGEMDANGGTPYIIIPAPSDGWSTTNTFNSINFELQYYAD